MDVAVFLTVLLVFYQGFTGLLPGFLPGLLVFYQGFTGLYQGFTGLLPFLWFLPFFYGFYEAFYYREIFAISFGKWDLRWPKPAPLFDLFYEIYTRLLPGFDFCPKINNPVCLHFPYISGFPGPKKPQKVSLNTWPVPT